MEILNYTIGFLLGDDKVKINPEYISNKHWIKYIKYLYYNLYIPISKYQTNDLTEAIRFSNKLLSMNFDFLKFVACVILIKSYSKMGDIEMENRYKEFLYKNSNLKRYRDDRIVL